jgi:hypothetical protein
MSYLRIRLAIAVCILPGIFMMNGCGKAELDKRKD